MSIFETSNKFAAFEEMELEETASDDIYLEEDCGHTVFVPELSTVEEFNETVTSKNSNTTNERQIIDDERKVKNDQSMSGREVEFTCPVPEENENRMECVHENESENNNENVSERK